MLRKAGAMVWQRPNTMSETVTRLRAGDEEENRAASAPALMGYYAA